MLKSTVSSKGIKAYRYSDLIAEMPSIIANPENYPELQKDMESIGYTKVDSHKPWLDKLINFVSNHVVESHLLKIYGSDYQLSPMNETFDFLEIRDGDNLPDFYCHLFNSTIEVKTYKSLASIKNAMSDIEFLNEATDFNDYRQRVFDLKQNTGRYVGIHNAKVVWFVCIPNNIIVCYNVKTRETYTLVLRWTYDDAKNYFSK